MKTTIRVRADEDMDRCVAVLADVHAADGYPLHWPADPRDWLAPKNLLAAWVAEEEDTVVGHMALCSAADDAASRLWSAAADLPAERFAAVARLFVAPGARGHGLGAALLDKGCSEARSRGLRAALDVLDRNRGAIALYERTGWRRVGSAPARWARANGEQPLLHYFIAPG